MSQGHNNNFDFLRLLAALCAWYAITGGAATIDYRRLGMSLFFLISGYLVTESYERHGSLFAYLRNRVLRVVPALAGALFVTALLTTLSLIPHADNSAPGFLAHIPGYKDNPPLWTLPTGAYCYLLIAALGVLGILQLRIITFLWGASALLIVMLAADKSDSPLLGLRWGLPGAAPYFTFLFLGGACMHMLRHSIPRHIGLLTGAILILLFAARLPSPFGSLLAGCALLYSVIYVAYLPVPLFAQASRWGDFSWGLYLYSWPALGLAHHFAKPGSALFLIVSLMITLICAALSWHLIEKRALGFKS